MLLTPEELQGLKFVQTGGDAMRMTVGEISKVLGMTTENIRYYVREGLIKPEKNKDNNYW